MPHLILEKLCEEDHVKPFDCTGELALSEAEKLYLQGGESLASRGQPRMCIILQTLGPSCWRS